MRNIIDILENLNTVTEAGHDKALLMKVVDQMVQDAQMGDYTAIEELLKDIPAETLQNFLSEED